MCFETTKSARAKIAKKDIECWKTLVNSYASFKCVHGIAFKYEIGVKTPNIKIRKVDDYKWIIKQGYHSYKSIDIAHLKMDFCVEKDGSETFNKFIIPKGTRYYENETEYVSETIIRVE